MIGIGTDLHRLEPLRRLIIGGIEIESELGCVAHSDGDVLLHSLTDALLGAAGLGDIGEHFPDTEQEFKNADSRIFVEHALKLILDLDFEIENVDAVIMLQKPKLSEYKLKIRDNIAEMLNIRYEQVNIKAKTGEKLGYIGTSLAIESMVAVSLRKKGS